MFFALFFLPKFKFSSFSYPKKFLLNFLEVYLTRKTEVVLNNTSKNTLFLHFGDNFSLTNLFLLDAGFLTIFHLFRHLDLWNRLTNVNLE